jgi:hypothetical protein
MTDATDWLPFDPPPVQALSRIWVGARCKFDQTGIGWPGPHHCWQCWVETERLCARLCRC